MKDYILSQLINGRFLLGYALSLVLGGGEDFSTLINGGRSVSYQRISYRSKNTPTSQPIFVSSLTGSGFPSRDGRGVSESEICDGNWHHIGIVQYGTGYIGMYFDGEYLSKTRESNPVDFGKNKGTGVLSELNGDNNSWSTGYFDDICLLGGQALWEEETNFDVPKYYLGNPICNLYENDNNVYGIHKNE